MKQFAQNSGAFLVDERVRAGHDLNKFSLSEEFFGAN